MDERGIGACPKCGNNKGPAPFRVDSVDICWDATDSQLHFVMCGACHAEGAWKASDELAIAAWNRGELASGVEAICTSGQSLN